MKPLRDGIVIWLQWAAGRPFHREAWFDDNLGIKSTGTLCRVCGELFDPGPMVIYRNEKKEGVGAGMVQHALNHLRAAKVRRSTIEALESLAAIVGLAHAAERLLGPSPEKKVA